MQFGSTASLSRPIPTVEEFDRKLAEADAYLQILIEQVSTLESRIDKFDDETQHERHEAVRDSAKVRTHPHMVHTLTHPTQHTNCVSLPKPHMSLPASEHIGSHQI